jgi:2-keto-4-pentenoate hydratase/2-oxohepta-3-ene-1,7-dioic acid hydratase in catechol pathway
MRLCRFLLEDDLLLVGYYVDDAVIPLDAAADAADVDLLIGASEELIDYLPPDGPAHAAAAELWAALGRLPESERRDLEIPLEDVRLLVPIAAPPKLLLLAGNYPKHVAERGGAAAERAETFPYVFMKPPSTTLTHPGDPIVLPAVSPDHVDWECELGVVIGRRGRGVSEAEALAHVAGYTVVNDVSDRRFRPNPGRKPRPRDEHFDWLHGKWHDTFCPMGPCVLAAGPGVDPQAFHLTLDVDGERMQDATTDQMVFPVAAIVAFVSSFVTLEPGDVIATGTPSGVGSARGRYLRPGEEVVAAIEGIGALRNPVVSEADA